MVSETIVDELSGTTEDRLVNIDVEGFMLVWDFSVAAADVFVAVVVVDDVVWDVLLVVGVAVMLSVLTDVVIAIVEFVGLNIGPAE